jgi:hypothetical protein
MKYTAHESYAVTVELNTDTRFYTVQVNGKTLSPGLFFAPLEKVERIVFRTGEVRRFPDADTPTDPMDDLPGGGEREAKAVYYVTSFKTNL